MMIRKSVLIMAVVLLGGLFLSRPGLGITPYDDAMVQQAVQQIQQENYDEAIALLTQAWEKGTHSPDKAFLLGQTYRLMLNYPKAKEYLEESLRLKPNFPQAQLMLADTLLAIDRAKEAMPVLEKLEASGYEPGQTAFLHGMAQVKEGKYSEALDYFRKAEQDPRVAQEAAFQASLALAALNRLKEARASMEKVITLNPETQTADFAKRYMGLLEKRLEEIRPFHIGTSFGFDFDSNVTLQAGGAGAAAQVAGQGDIVFTQTLVAEYNFLADKPFSVLTQYAYYENFHRRIPTYDLLSHYMAVIPTYNFKSGRFWLPFSFNYADVQSDKYYTGYLLTPTFLYLLNPKVGLEFGARYNRKYYWTPVFLQQDDRSSKNFGGSLGAYYFFKEQKGFLQARVSYERDFTTGNNWDCSTFRLLLAVLYPATDKLKFNVFLDMYLQPYDHDFFSGQTETGFAGAPFVVNPARYDKVLLYGIQATYQVLKGLEFNVHYFFTRADSNITIYDYQRHIVGCQLAYRY
jgi:tetratricopeptide (TPR) repeat protein